MENESTLSDALLRQLIAVGQVDILVGLPTLNNAATVVPVVRAVHECFTRDFPRLRTVLINSDGGSTDGTPDLIRDASFTETDMVQTSHSLRTLHRVVAPYGCEGGEAGQCGRQTLNGEELPGITAFAANAGDRLVIETPGGGGWGTA